MPWTLLAKPETQIPKPKRSKGGSPSREMGTVSKVQVQNLDLNRLKLVQVLNCLPARQAIAPVKRIFAENKELHTLIVLALLEIAQRDKDLPLLLAEMVALKTRIPKTETRNSKPETRLQGYLAHKKLPAPRTLQ